MKNKKLRLDELKVQSFVTSFSDQDARTIKGGEFTQPGHPRPDCDTGPADCNNATKFDPNGCASARVTICDCDTNEFTCE